MSLWEALYTFAVKHPGKFLLLWTTFTTGFWYFFGVFAQSLRAPTAQSSQAYLTFFQLVNAAAANWHRSGVPRVEDSPNFLPAVEKFLQDRAAATATVAAVVQVQAQNKTNGGTA